jgi:hypothetical protein
MKQLCALVAGFLSLTLLSCGGGASSGGGPSESPSTPPQAAPITVSISPSLAAIQINFSYPGAIQFHSTVMNTTNTAVSWEINGNPAGSNYDPSYGTISTTGLYTAPSLNISSSVTATITAISGADPSKSAAATVTILPPISVSISPSSNTVPFGGTQQFVASIPNNSNKAVTWLIATAGSADVVGTISGSGLYTAPPAGSLFSSVRITAYSVADPEEAAYAAVVLTGPPGPNDSELNGRYAFSVKGGDYVGDVAPNRPKMVLGSFQADGAGNLTGEADEIFDFVDPNLGCCIVPVPPAHESLEGSYTVGTDGRGSFVLLLHDATTGESLDIRNFQFALGSVVQGVATQGRFIESYGGEKIKLATGTLEKQDESAFSAATMNGDFSFGFSCSCLTTFSVLGAFHADGNGNIFAGTLDTNTDMPGNNDADILSNQAFTGSYGTVDDNGRASASLVIPGLGTLTLPFYVVSSTELLFIGGTAPDQNVFLGPAFRQTGGPFSNASLTGNSVFQLAADHELVAGQFVADGTGNVTGVLDQNLNGSVSLNSVLTGTYMVAANGRGTLTYPGGQPIVFYMIGPNQAFLLRTPPADPQIGLLEPQAPGPFTNASISGTFIGGTFLSVEPPDFVLPTSGNDDILASGVFSFDGAGNASGTVDLSGDPITAAAGDLAPDEPFAATYTVAANGRGTMTVTSIAGGPYVLYLISSTNFFTMYVGPEPNANAPPVPATPANFQPGLIFTK